MVRFSFFEHFPFRLSAAFVKRFLKKLSEARKMILHFAARCRPLRFGLRDGELSSCLIVKKPAAVALPSENVKPPCADFPFRNKR